MAQQLDHFPTKRDCEGLVEDSQRREARDEVVAEGVFGERIQVGGQLVLRTGQCGARQPWQRFL